MLSSCPKAALFQLHYMIPEMVFDKYLIYWKKSQSYGCSKQFYLEFMLSADVTVSRDSGVNSNKQMLCSLKQGAEI